MDVIVALPVAVLVLGMRQDHPNDWYLTTPRSCGEVTVRAVASPVTGDDLVESGDGRVVGRHDGDPDGQPPAMHELFMELADLPAVRRTADEKQVGVDTRISLLQAQTIGTKPGTPGDINTDSGLEQRVPHGLHAQHVARGGFAIEKRRPTRHEYAHQLAA